MSRAFTKEEVRSEFLNHLRGISRYWANQKNQTVEEQCNSLVFSILVMLDGGSGGMPAFNVAPSPHPDDKQYQIDNEQNYYEEGQVFNDDVQLHEMWYHPEKPAE